MKGRWLFWIIAANLLALVGLAFAYPHLMVSPGPVVTAHADIGTDCVTCHKGGVYSTYTCYGCHEHTPAKIRAEHEEEGIRDFENCVECHRDPGVDPERSARSGGKASRRKD